MRRLVTLVLGELATNCYLFWDLTTKKALIIDPADAPEFIAEEIQRRRLKPQAIVATHAHFDHLLAAGTLQLTFDLPLYLHQADKPLLPHLFSSAQYWLKRTIKLPPPQVNHWLKGGETLSLGQQKLQVYHTPGHTPGSICLAVEKEKLLFSGDTIFKDAVGRTDLPYSSPTALKKSLELIQQNFSGWQVFPGHGPHFSLTDHYYK